MLKFISKNWGKVSLALVLIFIVIINFRWGYFVLGNDNYSPEEDPGISVKRYLTQPAWREYRGLGVPSDSEQIDIFRSLLFFGLEKVGLPLWFISQMSVWLAFFCGPWFMAVLVEKVFLKKDVGNEKKNWLFLLSGLLYCCNLLMLWLFYSPLKPFIFLWGFLPMFLVASFGVLEKQNIKNILFFLIGLICVSASFMIPTIFVVTTLVVLMFCWQFWRMGKSIKNILFLVLVYLVWQLYWLVPFGIYVKTNNTQLSESIINKEITPWTIQKEITYNKWNNVPRFVNSWLDSKNQDDTYLFGEAEVYKNNWLIIFDSYIPFILVLLATFWLIKKYKTKYLPIIILWWAGFWLTKGSNGPMGGIYVWMQDHIPLFRQVFRWGSSKFWPMLLVPMPILICLLVENIFTKKRFFKIFSLALTVLLLIYIYPVFKAKLINDQDFVKIPNEYYQLKEYLEKNELKGRILVSPEANMLYFRNYEWGFFGSVFWNYFIDNPIIEKALITGSAENEDVFQTIYQMYYSLDPDLFYKTLLKYKVEYIIADKNASSWGNGYFYDWDDFDKQILSNQNFEKVGEWGKLTLLRVEPNQVETEVKTSVYFGHKTQSFITSNILQNSGDFLLKQKGEIIPILLDPTDLYLDKSNNLVLVHKYKGESGVFSYLNLNSELLILVNNRQVGNEVELKTGDEIKVVIPKINLGESEIKAFGSNGSVVISGNNLIIKNKNEVSGVYFDVDSPLEGAIMMMAAKGENKQAIPWEMNFRETKRVNNLFRYYGQMLKKESEVAVFKLPNEWKKYLAELKVNTSGANAQESINQIDFFWLGLVKSDWLNTKLIPKEVEISEVKGNNQAYQSGWGIKDGGEINGWEQGHIGDKAPIYWPNILTWIGLVINLGLVLGGILLGLKNTSGHAKD